MVAEPVAVIPVKCFQAAKSRLRPVLEDERRSELARNLFEHVDRVLVRAGIRRRIVLAGSPSVAELASAMGAEVRLDVPGRLRRSQIDRVLSRLHGDQCALVCMADLPLLTVVEVERILEELETFEAVVAPDSAPSDLSRGTNFLGVHASVVARGFATSFGYSDSYRRHRESLARCDVRWSEFRSVGTEFDLDEPVDWARYSQTRAVQ